ncbi:hypothetical protein Droror1_Dr00020650 [Drosera rotundifolia]
MEQHWLVLGYQPLSTLSLPFEEMLSQYLQRLAHVSAPLSRMSLVIDVCSCLLMFAVDVRDVYVVYGVLLSRRIFFFFCSGCHLWSVVVVYGCRFGSVHHGAVRIMECPGYKHEKTITYRILIL